ncbi:MAG: hypothetical protein P4L61_01195 [Candidatus Pacebacteria bacterium]|nr:hypothetical protein [Candidatus Paceibacterota bacterium]
MYSLCRARAQVAHRAASRALQSRRAIGAFATAAAAARHTAAAAAAPATNATTILSLHSSHSSTLGSSVGSAACPTRAFSSGAAGESTTAAAAAAPPSEEEGRASAPAGSKEEASQGQEKQKAEGEAGAKTERATGAKAKQPSILDVDPYPPERLAAIEKKYHWVDWNAMAAHLHMADVHFFDQEVPYVDQDFTIKPDFRLLQRLEGANRLKRLQEQEDKKIHRLLHFGYWVTSGRNVRVATEGKIQSVWTLVVGGDMNGTASYGFGKGEDMMLAEKRAIQDLRRNMLFVPLFESRTISHEIRGQHGVCEVRMWPRPRDRGMTAGLIPRMIFNCFGIHDITAKVHGRCLPHHQVMAIFNGLHEVKSLREEAIRRGVTAHRMFERGLEQPRHPGRKAIIDRGMEVAQMLREVRAMQTHENMMEDLGVTELTGEKKHFFRYPEFNEAGVHADADKAFVPSYIIRKPDPIDMGRHNPAPPHPKSTKPGNTTLFHGYRGLPRPQTPMTVDTNKIL